MQSLVGFPPTLSAFHPPPPEARLSPTFLATAFAAGSPLNLPAMFPTFFGGSGAVMQFPGNLNSAPLFPVGHQPDRRAFQTTSATVPSSASSPVLLAPKEPTAGAFLGGDHAGIPFIPIGFPSAPAPVQRLAPASNRPLFRFPPNGPLGHSPQPTPMRPAFPQAPQQPAGTHLVNLPAQHPVEIHTGQSRPLPAVGSHTANANHSTGQVPLHAASVQHTGQDPVQPPAAVQAGQPPSRLSPAPHAVQHPQYQHRPAAQLHESRPSGEYDMAHIPALAMALRLPEHGTSSFVFRGAQTPTRVGPSVQVGGGYMCVCARARVCVPVVVRARENRQRGGYQHRA